MSFSGGQGADLMQVALAGSYEWYLEREGVWLGDSSEGSINIPWLLALAVSLGNATTVALGSNVIREFEPEWGWEALGVGKDIRPGEQMFVGGGVGGWIQSW